MSLCRCVPPWMNSWCALGRWVFATGGLHSLPISLQGFDMYYEEHGFWEQFSKDAQAGFLWQSMERDLYWNLQGKAQIQAVVVQPVCPSHERYCCFDNRRGKHLLFKERQCYGNMFGGVRQEKILVKRKAFWFLKERFETAQRVSEAQNGFKTPRPLGMGDAQFTLLNWWNAISCFWANGLSAALQLWAQGCFGLEKQIRLSPLRIWNSN